MKLDSLTEKKRQLDEFRPLPDDLLRNLNEWFRIELTYTSNAIEGSTLTRRETALVVEKGLTVGGKSLVEHLEATNHAHALDFVRNQVGRKISDLSGGDILMIHEIILRGIDNANAGHFRGVPVRISGSRVVLLNPVKVPDLMEEFVSWLRQETELHPVELAAEAHFRLVTIHPFVDGNGRTARLLMNLILIMHGYPPAIIRKRDRIKYIGYLEQAQTGGSKKDYLNLIGKAASRSLDIYLKAMRGTGEKDWNQGKLLKIGELARSIGRNNSTIRHWTKVGLLDVAEVTESGYQLYASDMVEIARKIIEWQQERFTLQEIRQKLRSGE